jgi:hypothetical protein
MGRNGGDGWIPSSDVVVMLECIKDRVLGVDTLGQKVPPRARYGTTCLLIKDAVGRVPCLVEWENDVVTHLGSHGAVIPRSDTVELKPL